MVELRNLGRGRLDRHAQVERMCQLTAHRCFFAARSRTPPTRRRRRTNVLSRVSCYFAVISMREVGKYNNKTSSDYRFHLSLYGETDRVMEHYLIKLTEIILQTYDT